MSTIASSKDMPPLEPVHRIWRAWHSIHHWWIRQWTALRPGAEARRGGMRGILAVLTMFVGVRLVFLPSGFGLAFDAVFVIAATVIVPVVAAMIVALILLGLRTLPLVGTGVFVGACVLVTSGWFSQPSTSVTAAVIAVCVAACLLGASIGTIRSVWTTGSVAKRALASVLLAAVAAYAIGFVWVLADDGDLETISAWRPRTGLMPANLAASNPGLNGPYAVRTLFYGSGTDIRRLEYNSAVAIRTRAVDASMFFRGYNGWGRWARSRYWGFDVNELPLNARVWYPDGPGPFPLALIAHGNHRMNDFSDPGYEYLGELLASRGFILVSVDQNFLNGTPGFREPTAMALPTGREQAVRCAAGCCSNICGSGMNGTGSRAIPFTARWT